MTCIYLFIYQFIVTWLKSPWRRPNLAISLHQPLSFSGLPPSLNYRSPSQHDLALVYLIISYIVTIKAVRSYPILAKPHAMPHPSLPKGLQRFDYVRLLVNHVPHHCPLSLCRRVLYIFIKIASAAKVNY